MKRHDVLIAAAIAVVAVIFLAFWFLASGRLVDFGLNGFTETLGIAFTILLIDRLFKRREEARTLPQRLAAFEDVRLLAQRRIGFWFQAYMSAVPDPLPKHVQELFSTQSIGRIGHCLDLDSVPNVTPKRTWWQYIPEDLVSVQMSAERILERYNAILDPAAFLAVHRLLSTIPEPGLMLGILRSDEEMEFPRPRTLENYLMILPGHYMALTRLTNWLVSERQSLSKITREELGEISETLVGNRPDGIPPCMIAPQKLAAQIHALNEHRREKAGASAQAVEPD